MRSTVAYDFGYRENFTYDVLSAREVELADRRPGMYGWYLRLPMNASERLSEYTSIIAQKNISIEGRSGQFGERYEGDLTRQAVQHDTLPAGELLAWASAVFSPPIYIGISNNICRRLTGHLAALDRALGFPAPPHGSFDLSAADIDTVAESNSFGNRVAQLLRQHNISDTRWLFLKITYTEAFDRTDLRGVEYALNRAFYPLCGLR